MQAYLALLAIFFVSATSGQLDCFGEGTPKLPNIRAVAKGADDFALKMSRDIFTTYPLHSIVISPYSIWSVLMIAYYSSNGGTEQQLQSALGVPSKNDAFYGTQLLEAMLQSNNGTTFDNANLAYFDKSLNLRQCALDKIVSLQLINFKDSERAAKLINSDVSQATSGKINNFLNAGVISNAVMVLINAIYFKGIWEYKFDEGNTRKRPFYDETRTNKLEDIDMMVIQAKFKYAQPEGLQASVVELPYRSSSVSMLLILPDVGTTVNQVLGNLTSDKLDQIVENDLMVKDTVVILPRFKMRTRIADEVKEALGKLGIIDLFDSSKADMSKFVNEQVYVEKVLHHSTIEVTEEGTVAAAVTGLIGTRSGASDTVTFNANRPFLYLIRDNEQGITLFSGVLRSPAHTIQFKN